ncbi:hypothetical protein [Ekhidna sp.]
MIWFLLVSFVAGCNGAKVATNATQLRSLRLNFKNCGEKLSFREISIQVPEGYQLSKEIDTHGFCEYQLSFENDGVLYISSNIYTGSSLNYENRLKAGIETYSDNRSVNEQIKVKGTQADGRYWMEQIEGNYTVGYVNVLDTTFFSGSLQNIKLID